LKLDQVGKMRLVSDIAPCHKDGFGRALVQYIGFS